MKKNASIDAYKGLLITLVVLPRWLSFYFVGRITAIASDEKDMMQVVCRGMWSMLGVPVIVAVAMSVNWLHDNGWSNRIMFSYIAWMSGLVGAALSAGIAGCLSNPLWKRIGECSLGIMLLHKFIIVASVRLLPSGCILTGGSLAILLCGIMFATICVSWVASVAILRFCPALLGGKR